MDPYLIAKWLHILSSTVLFGTGIGTAFQMVWAWRTQNPRTIADVSHGVVWADCGGSIRSDTQLPVCRAGLCLQCVPEACEAD